MKINCEATGIIRRIDDLGRVVIPREIRRKVFGKVNVTDEPMEVFTDGKNIILRRYEEIQTCKWIKYDNKTICPKIHDVGDPYWKITVKGASHCKQQALDCYFPIWNTVIKHKKPLFVLWLTTPLKWFYFSAKVVLNDRANGSHESEYTLLIAV